MAKRVFIVVCVITLALLLCVSAFADTIRLKDGSVIRGEVVGFKDQQFTILVGGGARGRRSTMTLYIDDVESIEFDGATNAGASTGSGDDNSSGSNQSSTQNTNPVAKPTPSRPATQSSSSTQVPAGGTGSSGSSQNSNTRPTGNKPVWMSIPIRVKGDNTANGWTSSGYSVKRGQRIRVTATGQISLGNGRFSQPSGISTLVDKDKLMQDEPTGSLLAVVGDDNNDFIFIGRARDFVAQRDGVLFLGVNEGNLNDNTGAYDAIIEAEVMGSGR